MCEFDFHISTRSDDYYPVILNYIPYMDVKLVDSPQNLTERNNVSLNRVLLLSTRIDFHIIAEATTNNQQKQKLACALKVICHRV
jgi:hypothetical protein